MGSDYLTGYAVPLGNKNVLELDSVNGCTTL